MAMFNFKAKISQVNLDNVSCKSGLTTVLALPKSASAKLPSRGMVMIKGTINNFKFAQHLDPDGKNGHWFKVTNALLKSSKAKIGDVVSVSMEVTKDWPEPKVPADFKKVLSSNKGVLEVWKETTPMARWDWVRWISGAKLAKTRQHRMEVAYSKLKSGMRRPCCFNRSECSLTDA